MSTEEERAERQAKLERERRARIDYGARRQAVEQAKRRRREEKRRRRGAA